MFKSILVICSILFFSCNNSSSNSNPYGVVDCDNNSDINYTTCYHGILSGKIVDSDNNPVVNNAVILGYYNSPGGDGVASEGQSGGPPPTTPNSELSVNVNISTNGETVITLETKCGELIKTIFDGLLTTGTYTFESDYRENNGKILTPGHYLIKIINVNVEYTQNIFLDYSSSIYTSLIFNDDYNVHAITDEFGNFSIDITCEPFGYTYQYTNSDGSLLLEGLIPFLASFNIHNSSGHVYSTDFINIETGHIDIVIP